MKRLLVIGILLLLTIWSCELSHLAVKGSITAIPVSSNMARLDFSCNKDSVRVLGIMRSQGHEEPVYVTALQPSYSIYLDRDLTPGIEYTYYLVAYVGFQPEILAETKVIPNAIPEKAHYIRPGASGKNDGTDWYNAWTEVPELLERGHTYFFADGSYPAVIFETPEKGTEFIYLKKATDNNHGTDRGWISTYGDGQAVFEADTGAIIAFNNGYFDFDGQTGSGTTGHGFKAETSAETLVYAIRAGDDTNVYTGEIAYLNVYRTEMQLWGRTRTDNTSSGRGFQVHPNSVMHHSILSHIYIHDLPGICIYYVNTSYDNILEYSHIARNHSNAKKSHAEGIQTGADPKFNVVRYNYWEDIEGTSVLTLKTNWDIYGNVFFHTPDYYIIDMGQSGESLSQGIVTAEGNARIYNNSIIGISGGHNAAYLLRGANNEVFNNVWVDCAKLRFTGGTSGGGGEEPTVADYNGLYDIDDLGNHTEDNLQIFSSAPLNSHYLPVVETAPGKKLPFPYNIDGKGRLRGEDGVWTRGAFEY